MKTPKKLELAFQRIEGIRYQNENGGAYAYLQFMAYTRDVIALLRPVKKAERHVEAMEAMNWLFNEYMSARFTHSHQLIFEEKKTDIKNIFDAIRDMFHATQHTAPVEAKEARRPFDGKLYHAQAA